MRLQKKFLSVSFQWLAGLHTLVPAGKLMTGIIFILVSTLLYSCDTDKEIKEINTRSLGVEEILNADINYTLGGKPKARLLSPLMLRVQESTPYIEFPNTLHVDFYSETGTIDSRLDARYGKYYEQESKVFLKDSVRIINVKGDTLYCDELWWDRNRTGSEFYTEKPVRIRTPMQQINGVGMEARQDFKEYHIKVPTGTINVRNSEFPAD